MPVEVHSPNRHWTVLADDAVGESLYLRQKINLPAYGGCCLSVKTARRHREVR